MYIGNRVGVNLKNKRCTLFHSSMYFLINLTLYSSRNYYNYLKVVTPFCVSWKIIFTEKVQIGSRQNFTVSETLGCKIISAGSRFQKP